MVMSRMNSTPRSGARGFSMLETLVTLLIITLWLLGTAGVQSSSLRLNKAAQYRTYAILLATDISERMESNKASAVNGGYNFTLAAGGTPPSASDCTQMKCNANQLASYDLQDWATRAQGLLPNVALSVSADASTPINYTINIQWSDRAPNVATGSTETLSYTTVKSLFNDAM